MPQAASHRWMIMANNEQAIRDLLTSVPDQTKLDDLSVSEDELRTALEQGYLDRMQAEMHMIARPPESHLRFR